MKKYSLFVVAIVSALVASLTVYSGMQSNSWFQQTTKQSKTSNSAGTTTVATTAYTSSDTATTAYNKVKNAVVTVQNLQKVATLSDGWSSFFNQEEQRKYDASKGIITEAWSPLGRASAVLKNEVIGKIADQHDKTIPQVILRWQVQSNVRIYCKRSIIH